MNDLTHKASRAAWWSALEITARYGVQILVTIVLARLLSPSDFGLIAMLLVFTSIGLLLTDSGFGTALVQRRAISPDDVTTVFWFNLVAGLLATGLLWMCAGPIAAFYGQPRLVDLTHAMAWVLLLGAVGAVPDALLTRQLRFAARARVQLTASLVSGTTAIVLAFLGAGVWSLVIQVLTAAALRSGLLWSCAWREPWGRFSRASFASLFGFGGYMLLSGLLNSLSVRLQSLVIGRIFSAQQLGFYALAQNATQAPTGFISAVLGRVGLPVFSSLADDRVRLRDALRTSLQVSMFVFIPCMVGMALAAGPLIDMVYGPRWHPATHVLSLLALAGSIWPLHVLNLTALNAQGRSDRFLRLEVLKNIVVIVVTLVAAPFGITAIAGAMLVAAGFGAAINTWYTHRMLDYGMLAQLRDQRATFLLTGLAAMPAWALMHWLKPGIPATALAITVAFIIYLGSAAWLRHSAFVNLVAILRNLTRRTGDRPVRNA